MIRGSFKGLQELIRVCNALAEDGDSALVEVSTDTEKGQVVFVKGNLHAAQLGGREGISALREILRSENLSFLVRELPDPPPRKNVFVSLGTVLENMGFQDPFFSVAQTSSGDDDLPAGVETDIRIPESAEERVDDPRLQRAIRIFHDVPGVESVIYAFQGRVRGARGLGERDAHISRSAEELRQVREQAQRWVDRVMLLFNAATGVHKDRSLPRKILMNFPEQNRWLWARLEGEDLYIVWLDTAKLAFVETDVLAQMEQIITGAR